MKMPQVTECEMSECAYNKDNACHAMAITIGDGAHPRCDTFFRSAGRGGATIVAVRAPSVSFPAISRTRTRYSHVSPQPEVSSQSKVL